jgi:hypothetical protein
METQDKTITYLGKTVNIKQYLSESDEQFNNVLVYRQALRDLNVHGLAEGTTRTKTIDDVTWPTNPLT